MMKRYLLFCQLALLPVLTVQAQFTAGTSGFFIRQDTQVFIDSLTLKPSVDFLLTSQTLTISPTPIPGNPPSIARVYNLTSPVNFTGVAGFFTALRSSMAIRKTRYSSTTVTPTSCRPPEAPSMLASTTFPTLCHRPISHRLLQRRKMHYR